MEWFWKCREQNSMLNQCQPNTCHGSIHQSLAFSRKCMAVAVTCVDVAAEPVRVRRLFSFPAKHRVKYTCEPFRRSSCEIYTRHCQGCETNRNQNGKEGDFWNGRCRSFCRSSSRLWELGSCFAVSWRPRPWGRGLLDIPTRRPWLSL
jgi:hypothetical protein